VTSTTETLQLYNMKPSNAPISLPRDKTLGKQKPTQFLVNKTRFTA
jgi:hypothetical protein